MSQLNIKVSSSSVERGSVIPDSNVIGAPLVFDCGILEGRNHIEKILENGITFTLGNTDNGLSKVGVDKKRFVPSNRVGTNNRVFVVNNRAANVLADIFESVINDLVSMNRSKT